jgi:imidazolonepropionase-like amidohydrolase
MVDQTIVTCGTLIDGLAGEPRSDAAVVVEDGRIAAVTSLDEAPDDADVIDHSDETVIPGLIDAHLHLKGWPSMDQSDYLTYDVAAGAARATVHLRRLLDAGFTTVRDVDSRTALGLRTAVEEGSIPGPRIHTSHRAIYQTGGHGDAHYLPYEWVSQYNPYDPSLCDGADECRKEARKRIREGVDLIKIGTTGGVLSEKDHPDQSQMTDDEIAAVTQEAHRVGIPVAAHAQGAGGIKNALRNGVDTIEHGIYIDDEGIELLLETDGVLVPTLAIVDRICEVGADHGIPEFGLEKAREAREAHFDAVRRAYAAGATIALGTDFVGPELVPHGENAMEAVLYVEECGMSPMDALKTATSEAAKTLKQQDVGAIEPGRYADLVALEGDPLDDISALREAIGAVYKGGERVDSGDRSEAE